MKSLKLLGISLFFLLTSCNGTEFYYSMEGSLIKNQEIISTMRSIDLSFNLGLKDSEELAVYAFQLQDLKSHKLLLHITKAPFVQLETIKLKVEATEINIPLVEGSDELVIEDAIFLSIISKKILENQDVDIQLTSSIINGVESSPINIEIILKIKGTFAGGH